MTDEDEGVAILCALYSHRYRGEPSEEEIEELLEFFEKEEEDAEDNQG